jgi:hypothetical protein
MLIYYYIFDPVARILDGWIDWEAGAEPQQQQRYRTFINQEHIIHARRTAFQ